MVDVRPGEERATLLACLYFFFTMASYFVLRPIRDEMAVASGVKSLSWLFAGTMTAMLLVNPLYGALVVRFPVKRFIAITYQVFALCLVLFYLLWRAGVNPTWTGRVFFVWTSVFNLFVVSVFWSVMADSFRSAQAKRLFGFIAVGGTLGSITGSAITATLVRALGSVNLLLVSMVLLEAAALLVALLPAPGPGAVRDDDAAAEADAGPALRRRAIGGSMWAGITHVMRSPYLTGIAGFLILYTLGSTVLYFAQTDIIGAHFASRDARTEALARIELTVQSVTALTQLFLTGRLIRTIGLPAALALMPAISVIGFAALGISGWGLVPVLGTYVAFNVARRASNYAVLNPAMEVLFTVVPREDKYKAKSFIETFVYRLGDQLGAWGYAGLAASGMGLPAISWVAVPVSMLFLGVGVWLGRRQVAMAREAGVGVEPVARGVALSA